MTKKPVFYWNVCKNIIDMNNNDARYFEGTIFLCDWWKRRKVVVAYTCLMQCFPVKRDHRSFHPDSCYENVPDTKVTTVPNKCIGRHSWKEKVGDQKEIGNKGFHVKKRQQ
jgi:hypothetical protein